MSAVVHLADDLEAALATAPSTAVLRRSAPPELLVRPALPDLIGMALTEWVALGVCWAAMAGWPSLAPLAILVLAGRLHALGVILHDAAHLPLRRHGPLVRILELLAGYPVATTVAAMRYHHLRHHRDSGMPTDPYFRASVQGRPVARLLQVMRGLLLIPWWSLRPYVGLLSLAFPSLRPRYARAFLQDRRPRTTGDDEELRRCPEVAGCARAEFGQALFQLGVLAAWWSWPLPVTLGYAVPVMLSGLLAANRLLSEHTYEPTSDRSVETLLATTCDHHLGWSGRLLWAPRNIGLHVVHHLHPQVSLRALPALRTYYRQQWPDAYGGRST